jgi:mono/diheme cytochrome c family protein
MYVLVALIAALAAPSPPDGPVAPSSATDGAVLYQQHCAACHGPEARGDGPLADVIAYRPADLTRIALRSHGHYPAARVRDIIDGRKPVKGRFPAGMPVWGEAFKNSEDGYSEKAVIEKIAALADYLGTLQAPR